mgnify:CR=1 FL=1
MIYGSDFLKAPFPPNSKLPDVPDCELPAPAMDPAQITTLNLLSLGGKNEWAMAVKSHFDDLGLGNTFQFLPLILASASIFTLLARGTRQLIRQSSLAPLFADSPDKLIKCSHVLGSIFNAVVVSGWSFSWIANNWHKKLNVAPTEYEPEAMPIMDFAMGYFLWDLAVSHKYFHIYKMEFLMHAIMGMFVLLIAASPYGMRFAPYFLTIETSTIFLMINKIFLETGNSDSIFFNLSNTLFQLTYFVFRILFLPVYLFAALQLLLDSSVPALLPVKVAAFANCFGLTALSYYWFILMARKGLFRKSKPSSAPAAHPDIKTE